MSEVLLQAIIEKLGSLQAATLELNNAGKDDINNPVLIKEIKTLQTEITKLPSQLRTSNEKVAELLKGISALSFNLNTPINKQVRHSHHLHKGIWVAIGLFLISLFLLFGWINASNSKEQFEANDIKYRYLKANGNRHLIKLLYHVDSLYTLNKDYFTKQVVLKEQNLAEQARLFQLADEKKMKPGN